MKGNQAVFGVYECTQDTQHAVALMRSAGFRDVDLSVLCAQNLGNKDLAFDKATKAPEGVVAGVSAGAIAGGALGWLTSIGTLVIPGAGPFLAAGPLLGLMAGAGIGGAVAGLAGALIGAGIPEFEARRYAGRIHTGHILLSVHCDNRDWADRGVEVLRQSGAQDISRTSEAEAEFDASERPHRKRDSAQEYEADFQRNFESFHRELGAFEDFAPVYDWGFRMAKDPRYRDQTFEKAEPDLKQVFCVVNPSLEWAKVAMLVLYGWEQAGGKIEHPFAII